MSRVEGAPVTSCTWIEWPQRQQLFYTQGCTVVWAKRQEEEEECCVDLISTIRNNNEQVAVACRPTHLHGIKVVSSHQQDDNTHSSIVVVWGGPWLWHVSVEEKSRDDDKKRRKMICFVQWRASDWIEGVNVVGCLENDQLLLSIGLAHGRAFLWKQGNEQEPFALTPTAGGLLYSLDWRTSDHAQGVLEWAVGTVTHQVWVGRRYKGVVTHTLLQGHQGVVHALAFDDGCDEINNRLATVSEDRSVRLWRRDREWTNSWIAWGHKSRIWAVAFSSNTVISAGQDCTVRTWCAETGRALAVYGSKAQVRSLAVCCGMLAAGHEDGLVLVHDVRRGDIMRDSAVQFPDDRRKMLVKSKSTEKEESEPFVMEKVTVVGMEFIENGQSMLLATRTGKFWKLDVANMTWGRCGRWVDEGSVIERAIQGCCISIHPTSGIVAVGTTHGDVSLAAWQQDELKVTCIIDGRRWRSVQRLVWMDESTLLVFHVGGLAVHYVDKPINEVSTEEMPRTFVSLLQMKTRGMCISGAFASVLEKHCVVTGDTRGNLALFQLDSFLPGADLDSLVHPISTQTATHKKEHVNEIVIGGKRVFSAGNDGCVAESYISPEEKLCLLRSVQIGGFTGVTHLWAAKFSSCEPYTLFAGGYRGNTFATIHLLQGYEYFRVETGGRQRMLSFWPHLSTSLHGDSRIAIKGNVVDGQNGVRILQMTRGCGDFSIGYSSGRQLHSESIFDCCALSIDADRYGLLTASEDCSSRVSIYRGDQLEWSAFLPSQANGVRSVAACQCTDTSTLCLVGGGGLTLQAFIVYHHVEEESRVRFLGHCRSPDKIDVDQRINSICCVNIEDVTHVFVGDSEGKCWQYTLEKEHLKEVEQPARSFPKGFCVHQWDRPILSMAALSMGEKNGLVVAVGTSDGLVTLLGLNMPLTKEPCRIVAVVEAHSMGANGVALWHTKGTEVEIVSVGDDQAICYCTVDVLQSPNRLYVRHIKNAGMSAFRGVARVSHDSFVTVGYDQCVCVWSRGPSCGCFDECWLKKSTTRVPIGDVNCLATTHQRVAVGGAGIAWVSVES